MSLWKIAWRSIQQRSLASVLTSISMALGVMLVVAVLVFYVVVDKAFHRGGEGYDLIVGPTKGSNLDLVITSIFYVGQPLSTLPYNVYKDLEEGRLGSGSVRTVVPVCLGDTYEGHRVVGTTSAMFNELTYFGDKTYQWAEGGNFGEQDYFDAVAGANAARRTGLKLGDTFRPTHDASGKSDDSHRPFKIVGILQPTGTPNDNALFVNIEGFYRVGGHTGKAGAALVHQETKSPGKAEKHEAGHDEHDHDHDAAVPDELKQVSAVLVCTHDESQTRPLVAEINKRKEAQAAIPAEEIARLFNEIIGNIQLVLLVFAVMIVIVAGIGIMVSIYNSMNDRRHEIAIMRALGARRGTIMLVILLESILLSVGGGVLGLLLGHGLLTATGPWVAEKVNLPLTMLQFDRTELILIPALVVLASIVGYLPALAAYRTDVGKSLMSNP